MKKPKCIYAVLLLAWFLWIENEATKEESPNERITGWSMYETKLASKDACEAYKEQILKNISKTVGGKRLGNSGTFIASSGRRITLSCHPEGFNPEKKKAEKFKSI